MRPRTASGSSTRSRWCATSFCGSPRKAATRPHTPHFSGDLAVRDEAGDADDVERTVSDDLVGDADVPLFAERVSGGCTPIACNYACSMATAPANRTTFFRLLGFLGPYRAGLAVS